MSLQLSKPISVAGREGASRQEPQCAQHLSFYFVDEPENVTYLTASRTISTEIKVTKSNTGYV